MKSKTEFICIQPKTIQAKSLFNNQFKSLHSCKVLEKNDDSFYVKSIAGEYYFWVNKKEDNNWSIVK